MTEPRAQPDGPWEFEDVPCDYCGTSDAEELFIGPDRLHGLPGQFGVVRCRRCGLVRTSPRPTLESLGTAYPREYSPHVKTPEKTPPTGLLRWALVNYRHYPLGTPGGPLLRWLLSPLARRPLNKHRNLGYLPYVGAGRLLDFGCGAGRYLARMAAAGWQAEGMDMSAEAVRAAGQVGLTIHQGTLPGAELPAESYDTVTMWQAIEHVPSPKATLDAIARILTPGGQLLVVCPQWDSAAAERFGPCWYGLDLPRHLTHFTPATLARHLDAAGFDVVRTRSCARPGWTRKSWAYLADQTGQSSHRRRSKGRLWVGLGSRIAQWRGRAEEILCLARKR